MAKYIFVTGGVISSLGKGLTTGALAMLLQRRGLKVRIQKLDPYINVDPGTMNPYEHGEVYVTDDGTETDLDLGHYERFTDEAASRDSNYTTGQIYSTIIEKERRGDFLGGTVQVIPHVTNEIKSCIRRVATDDTDVVITELGGTVGDIEGLPFLEAIRQMRHDEGRSNVIYIHLTLVPYITAAGELKTKPTQQSVGRLREIGIQPDVIICRTETELGEDSRKKIALFCNVEDRAVIEERDVATSIYEIPEVLVSQNVDTIICDYLGFEQKDINISDWHTFIDHLRNPVGEVRIAVVGKYIKLQDAYKSIYEALTHAGAACTAKDSGSQGLKVIIDRIEAEELETQGVQLLQNADGILVPGGFGERGIEGKLMAVRYARENNIPFLGICLGLQCAAIEFARNVLDITDAHTAEVNAETANPVIALLDEQQNVTQMGGTMRLGAYDCVLKEDSKARAAYNQENISERHRHRYEFNNAYRAQFEEAGMTFSGLSPDGGLVEMLELQSHPWFVATQAHPEFKSRPIKPHPLFVGLVQSAANTKS